LLGPQQGKEKQKQGRKIDSRKGKTDDCQIQTMVTLQKCEVVDFRKNQFILSAKIIQEGGRIFVSLFNLRSEI